MIIELGSKAYCALPIMTDLTPTAKENDAHVMIADINIKAATVTVVGRNILGVFISAPFIESPLDLRTVLQQIISKTDANYKNCPDLTN